MIEIEAATLAGEVVSVCAVESPDDYAEVLQFNRNSDMLAFDTESTGYLGMYRPDWEMRLFQIGDTDLAYVIPVAFRDLIVSILSTPRRWVAHNAPHDVLTLDLWLGYETNLLPSITDTRILSHLLDSRSEQEGGVGHRLKRLSMRYVDRNADDGEKELKAAFKDIKVPIEGEVYKSGKRKGEQKYRAAHLSEGWRLIHTYHPAYIKYAGMDPILTMRVYQELSLQLKEVYGGENDSV